MSGGRPLAKIKRSGPPSGPRRRRRSALLARALRAERRADAIAAVGRLFTEPRPMADLTRDFAAWLVEELADIALVQTLDIARGPRLATDALVCRDPRREQEIRDHLARHPVRLDDRVAPSLVCLSGKGLLIPAVGAEDLARLARPEDAALLRSVGLRSAIFVPLRGRGRVFGTVALGRTRARRFGEDELVLAEEVALLAAAAFESSFLMRELLEERARLAAVIDQMPEGVVIADRDGRLIQANRVARRMAGIALPAAEAGVSQEEQRVRCADGAEVPVLLNAGPVVGPCGEVEAVVGVFQDVSERKRFEARLAELADLAAARARRLEGIIACIADGVLVLDPGGRVILANQGAAALLGVPRGDLLRPIEEYRSLFSIRDAEGIEPKDLAGRRALSGATIVGEERSIRRRGEERLLQLSAAPLRDGAGGIEGAVIVLVDITRVRELERARDEFLSIASHELKTPLTPMLSITELIARALDRGEPVDRLLVGRLLRQIQRLDGLVVEMLDLARLGEGRLDVALDPVPLRPLIDRVVEDYRDSAPRHEIRWCPPAAPLIVRGDEHRLEEVLSNIVENAVKYSPAGGPIDIILSVAGGRAEIAVRDRGIGIPAADLPHMFERFRRGRNVARHYGGLGVGLFISREIVRRHGGDVRVESIEGKGTRVVIELPLA